MLSERSNPTSDAFYGIQIGEALKQKFGNKKPDTESLKAIFQLMHTSFGAYTSITYEYKVTLKTLPIVIAKHPLYERFKAAGLDYETIGKMCKAMIGVELSQVRSLYLKIEDSAQFKDSHRGSCIEKWAVK